MPTLPVAGREVSRLHIRPHTFEILKSLRYGLLLSDSLMEVLYAYQQANSTETYPYPLVIKMDKVTRGEALTYMISLSMDIAYAQQHHDFGYAIDWWWRTPSSAGEGELRIGFRVCGIYEMIR